MINLLEFCWIVAAISLLAMVLVVWAHFRIGREKENSIDREAAICQGLALVIVLFLRGLKQPVLGEILERFTKNLDLTPTQIDELREKAKQNPLGGI